MANHQGCIACSPSVKIMKFSFSLMCLFAIVVDSLGDYKTRMNYTSGLLADNDQVHHYT
jgi:hypothetical protein